jgi:hypothetical protein
MRNDYKKDRQAHDLGAGFAGMAAGVSAGMTDGLGAGLIAGAKESFDEGGLGSIARAGQGMLDGAREGYENKGVGGAIIGGIKGLRRGDDYRETNDMEDRHLHAFSKTYENGEQVGWGADVGHNLYDRQQKMQREKEQKK